MQMEDKDLHQKLRFAQLMVSENHNHHRGDGGESKRSKVNPMSWCWGGWWVAKKFDAMSTALSLNKEW